MATNALTPDPNILDAVDEDIRAQAAQESEDEEVRPEGPYETVSRNAAVMEAYMGTTEAELEGVGH